LNRRPLILLAVLAASSPITFAQQPNGVAGLIVQFRQGPPFPIVANAPNAGTLTAIVYGPPNAGFAIAMGPLNPGAGTLPGGQILDLGTPPAFADVTILANGIASPSSPFHVSPLGFTEIVVAVPTGAPIVLPPIQAVVADPAAPGGFVLTAASAITLLPAKSVLFLQGDFDPGILGLGPHCRLSDPSPVGFSTLRDVLLAIGFNAATEVEDVAVTITPQLLAPHGVLVLGSNRRTFTTTEVDAVEAFVRGGGGLVTYSDFMFGPGSAASDNQVLARFGLLTADDNFGGTVTAGSFAAHPVSAGLPLGIRGEGVSVIEIVGNAVDTFVNVAPCVSNGAACAPVPVVAPSGSATPTYGASVAVSAGLGRVLATFDRNTFFNYPGYGTSIVEASNLPYAVNLFLWAAGY
jgi:hypothetical protein